MTDDRVMADEAGAARDETTENVPRTDVPDTARVATVGGSGDAPLEDPNLGRQIGSYRLESLLSQGGMGQVYLARRVDDFEQRVALKLIQPRLRTAEVLERFYNERQILAQLDHPNIARLLDGGATDEALPYFVMEHIDGERIDHYCESRRLGLRRRLELFREICSAVHYAHQSLVVHRDLKPGNILVTADGVPKLLDFGIAKILAAETADQGLAGDLAEGPPPAFVTGASSPRHHPMTPTYASPEQILGKPITTASDVYSLGVLLYRLVSGHPPYSLESIADLIRLICIEESPPPSAVVGERRLSRLLAGDVDAIVAKAMRKEPAERYASALQLAEDVERHLDELPVTARPGTWAYRTGKLVRRRKLEVAASVLVLVLAVVAIVLGFYAVEQRGEAEQEREQAVLARERAETALDFLENLFESSDPEIARGRELTVHEVLDEGRRQLAEGALDGQPADRAELLSTLGRIYNNVGDYAEARAVKKEVLRLRREISPEDSSDLASDLNNLGRLLYDVGEYVEAEEHLREALAMYRRLGDRSGVAVALLNLAATVGHQGRSGEALLLNREVLEIRRQLYGDDSPRVASSLYALGFSYYSRGELDRAEELLRQALAIYLEAHGREHTRVAAVLNTLGPLLHAQGRHAEARAQLEEALVLRRQLLGDDHDHVANTEKSLAAVLVDLGELDAAAPLLDHARAVLHRVKPEDDWIRAEADSIWGAYLHARGRLDEAEPILAASYAVIRAVKGDDDVATQKALERLVAVRKTSAVR